MLNDNYIFTIDFISHNMTIFNYDYIFNNDFIFSIMTLSHN